MNKLASLYLAVCFVVTSLFLVLAVYWLVQDIFDEFSLEQKIIAVDGNNIKVQRKICSSYTQDISIRHSIKNLQTNQSIFYPSQFFILREGCNDYDFDLPIKIGKGYFEYRAFATLYLNPLLSHEIRDITPLEFEVSENGYQFIPPSP